MGPQEQYYRELLRREAGRLNYAPPRRVTSAANTAAVAVIPGRSGYRLIIPLVYVVLRAAAAGADVSIALQEQEEDSETATPGRAVVHWQDFIGSGAARGSGSGFIYDNFGIPMAEGKSAALSVAAAGAGAITELTLHGFYEPMRCP